MPQEFYTDGTPSRTEVDDDIGGTHTLILSGVVTIIAGDGQTLITLNETQLRSLAHHSARAVSAMDEVRRGLNGAGEPEAKDL